MTRCISIALWLPVILLPASLLAQDTIPLQSQIPADISVDQSVQTPNVPIVPPVELLPGKPASNLPTLGPSRIQPNFPAELILPPPSDATRRKASRFVESQIEPELPLPLVLGRPKILRLADTPTRIYIPDDETIRTEVIDQETGRELAVTGVSPGTTTLMLWFNDEDAPSGQSVVSYLVRVYADPSTLR